MINIGIFGSDAHLSVCKELFKHHNETKITFQLLERGYAVESDDVQKVNSYSELHAYDGLLFFNNPGPDASLAIEAIKMSKHVYLEHLAILKPREMQALLENVKEANVVCACGSDELFHPAFLALQSLHLQPQLIETRYSRHSPVSKDGHLLLEDIIRHLAVILKLVSSDVKRLQVNGLSVRGIDSDVVSARLEFANGCVANILVDQTGIHTENRIQIYEQGRMCWIDLEKQEGGLQIPDERSNQFISSRLNFETRDPFKAGLENFVDSMQGHVSPLNPLRDNAVYLETAHKILKRINSLYES